VKKRLWKLTGCLMILSLLIPYTVFADKQVGGPELEIKSAQAAPGRSAAVDIVIHRPKGLKTFEFTLRYDRKALEIADRDVAKGADVAGWMFEHKVNSVDGTVRIAAVNIDGFKSNNQASIAHLTFKAKGSAGVKPFSVTDLKGFMDLNKPASLASKTGAFTIQGAAWQVSVNIDGTDIQGYEIDNSHAKRVTIKIDAPTSPSRVNLAFDKDAMGQIAGSGKSLVVQTPIGSLELDSRTIDQLANSRIEIRIETAEGSGRKPARRITIVADGQEVERYDGKVKISVPYVKEASEADENIVAYRTVAGRKMIVPQSAVSNGQVLLAAGGSGTFEIGYNAKNFSDTAKHWSGSNISFVTARDLFKGVGNDRFAPEGIMTRGMFVTVLGRMLGIEGVGKTSGFRDVDDDAYYAPYVAFASEHGIVKGVGAGNFAPDREMSREEMAIMIARFLEHAQIETTTRNASQSFEDQEAIAAWAAAAIQQLQASGLIDGKPGNYFDPQGSVKRAEVAKVVRLIVETSLYIGA
jgi:hypothetical protein